MTYEVIQPHARMLAVLMGLQAGMPPFDFGGITGRHKPEYFAAVQLGMDYNYAPMEEIFKGILVRTLGQG
jgi:cell filamentation protein